MLTWADAHRRAAVMAAELHSDLGISLEQPVDVFDAIRQLGLVLAVVPLGRVAGLYLPHQPHPGVLLNALHPRSRQRYSAGHELGHHVFGHAETVDFDLDQASLHRDDALVWPDREKEAEAFAAWFLMPRRLIGRSLRELGIVRPALPSDVYRLALWLGTSYAATAWHLSTVRLATESQAAMWVKTAPREIKKGLVGRFAPDNMRNDVWWLGERDSGHRIDARSGDRIVVTLDEIPTSGFSWRMADVSPGLDILADSDDDAWEPLLSLSPESAGDDNDVTGGTLARSFLIDISAPATLTAELRLSLVCDRSWETGHTDDSRFDLSVHLTPALRGVQVDERELALTA